ncbi:MAG: phosphatase [Clostridia bacterium]|nr:phosphatase [Clostridia bacterium]
MLKADLHCHTLASAHAYSTLLELLTFAKRKGLSVLAMTDHGPALPDSPQIWHFRNLRTLPEEYDGIRLLRGVEANIMDEEGTLDLPDRILSALEWVIASFHDDAYRGGDAAANTKTWLNIIKNPHVDMLGHPDRLPFVFDHETVIKACREYGKVLEINNHSFRMTRGSVRDLEDIVRLCKKYDVLLGINSDAHVCFDVGEVSDAERLINDFGYNKDLVINYSPEMILELVSKKRGTDG